MQHGSMATLAYTFSMAFDAQRQACCAQLRHATDKHCSSVATKQNCNANRRRTPHVQQTTLQHATDNMRPAATRQATRKVRRTAQAQMAKAQARKRVVFGEKQTDGIHRHATNNHYMQL